MGMTRKEYIQNVLNQPKEVVTYNDYLMKLLGFENYSNVRSYFIRQCKVYQMSYYDYVINDMIYRYCVVVPKREYAGEKIILKSSRFYVCEIG